jgi:hypothetical protein
VPSEGFLDISVIAPRIQGDRGADRGFVAGRSGAGKSYLARRLLTTYGIGKNHPKEFRGNLVVIDPNGTFDYPAEDVYETVESIQLNPKVRSIRYVPRGDQLSANTWNALWKKLFNYPHPLMTYVDETRAMEPMFGTKRFEEGNYLAFYLTRGRALFKGAILGAQRPVTIPRDIIGQAEWFYIFDLPVEDDRATIAGTIGEFGRTGKEVNGAEGLAKIRDRKALGRFEFWFLGPDLEMPVKAQIVK